jgi:hypothetical protein
MKTAIRLIAIWACVAFALHLVWEIVHLPLYGLWRDDNSGRIAIYVLHCTVGNVSIATSVFLGTVVVLRRLDWPLQTPWLGGLLMVTAGLVYTVFSEWYNVYQIGAWSYAATMPLVGGIGLSPLLQWLVVPSLMVMAMRWLSARPIRVRERQRGRHIRTGIDV